MKMAEAVGAPKGAGWDNNSRVALGTAEVSPLDQASAYATFANDGTHVANHVVKRGHGRGRQGHLPGRRPRRSGRSAQDIARDVTYALSNVVEQGTGGTVRTLDRPVAGKTGTKDVEDDIISAWFVAYTPQISTAVMYVAGDGRQRRPRRLRPARRQHLLRRHLPGADLGRLHADGHEGPAGRGLRRAGVRQPRRRTTSAAEPDLPRPETRRAESPDRGADARADRARRRGADRGAVGRPSRARARSRPARSAGAVRRADDRAEPTRADPDAATRRARRRREPEREPGRRRMSSPRPESRAAGRGPTLAERPLRPRPSASDSADPFGRHATPPAQLVEPGRGSPC